MGAAIVARERGGQVGVLYLFVTLAVAAWFLSFGGSYLAADERVADAWIRLGHVGVAFVPTLILQFSWSLLRPPRRLAWVLWPAWLGSIAFAVASLAFRETFDTPYRYSWGYYPHYTAYSAPLVAFVAAYFMVTVWLYRRAWRRARPTGVAARRARLLLVAFSLGLLGVVDFLPSFGIDFYPLGCVPIMLGIGLTTYVTWRYRLVDVTPEFAAQHIIETMNDGLFVLDKEGVVRVANSTLLEMIGVVRETFVDQPLPGSLRRLLAPSELAAIRAGQPLNGREIEYTRPDGATLVLSLSVSVMHEGGKENVAYVGVVRDITETKRAENRIRFLAYYDNLTHLPNRQAFQERLRAALMDAAQRGRVLALLFLDLDHFKRINDTLGHAMGDRLLQAVAARLIASVRKARLDMPGAPEPVVARLGGDEFIVALTDIGGPSEAAEVAELILAALAEPVRLDEHEVAVTASLGISVYPHDGEDAETLLKNADAAMYQAKDAGRRSYVFYDRVLNAATYDRLSLEVKLRRALEREDLTLVYQPQVALPGGEVIGVEALLRWTDPELGPVPPERFIAIAEESGLVLQIGEWVLRTACRQARAWRDAGFAVPRVAVNLSVRQFRDPDLASTVRAALDAAGLDPRRLELELTESMLMQDALHTRRALETLKEMGVRLSIDDFGKGYSSLSYLRSFPLDALKIDRSFVSDISAGPDDGGIVVAIIALARTLELDVIAEGVETEVQRAFLQRNGCTAAQGFLFCKPLPAPALERWLRRGARESRSAG